MATGKNDLTEDERKVLLHLLNSRGIREPDLNKMHQNIVEGIRPTLKDFISAIAKVNDARREGDDLVRERGKSHRLGFPMSVDTILDDDSRQHTKEDDAEKALKKALLPLKEALLKIPFIHDRKPLSGRIDYFTDDTSIISVCSLFTPQRYM